MNQPIPVDAYLWLGVAIVMAFLGFSGFKGYSKSKSKASLYSGSAWATLSLGLFLWSIPLIITRSDAIITSFIYVGTILYIFSFFIQAIAMWHVVLRPRVPALVILIPAFLIFLATAYLDWRTFHNNESYVEFTSDGILLQQLPALFSLLMISVYTLGFYFIRVANKIDKGYARIRAYILGVLYILFATQQVFSVLAGGATGSSNTLRNIVLLISTTAVAFIIALSSLKHNTPPSE